MQHFHLDTPVLARYVQLNAEDNYGGSRLAIAELEVYGLPAPSTVRHVRRGPFHRDIRSARRSTRLASVQYIYHGLTVQPPKAHRRKGTTKMALYQRYPLQTAHRQRASIRFRDGTTLHLDQLTDAVLGSPHVTRVTRGRIDQIVEPGTDHRVRTASAVASAIGTNFIVRVRGKLSTFIVVEGAIQVRNGKGTQVVKSGEETTVNVGHAPTPPVPAPVGSDSAWTRNLPTPAVPENFALDGNGGGIIAGQ